MVQQITRYKCGNLRCTHEPYNTRKEAEKCEAKGVLGPEVEPGLIISRNDKNSILEYKIFVNILHPLTANRDHERLYSLMNVKHSKSFGGPWKPVIETKGFKNNLVKILGIKTLPVSFETTHPWSFRELARSFNDGEFSSNASSGLLYKFLTDGEFNEINNQINNFDSFGEVKQTLAILNIKQLYNNHEALKKAIVKYNKHHA